MELGKLTENYGLLKPDRQDFYNVEDFNKNADILDSALKALKDKGISLEEVINSLARVAKSGDYADLINAPTSLPANGGNADTVDGKHASDFAKANLPTSIPVPLNISGASAKWYRLFCFNPIAGGIINFSLAGLHPFNIGASFVVSASWDKADVNVISYSTNFSSPRVKEIRVGYNYNGDNLHYVDIKLEVTEALVSSGVLFLTIGTDSNVGNKNIDLSKLGSDVDSVTYGNSCAKTINKTFLGYTDLGSTETDINTVLVTGIYKCTNFKNYPKGCADAQGILRVENYMSGNSSFVSGTMGVDSMWLKQYYTEPHYGKTYERSVSAKSIGAWQLVGDGCNASKFDGFTYDEMYEDIGYKGIIKQKWEGELKLNCIDDDDLYNGSIPLPNFNPDKCLATVSLKTGSAERLYYLFTNKQLFIEANGSTSMRVSVKVFEFY